MVEMGGNPMVLAMGVSDADSVGAGLAQVRATIPPISGVAFGPLVLQDVMFENIVKFPFDKVNEWELHALFAEAAESGRDKACKDADVTTGIPLMDPINLHRIPYYNAPRFSYFKLSDRKANGNNAAGATEFVKDPQVKAETIDLVDQAISCLSPEAIPLAHGKAGLAPASMPAAVSEAIWQSVSTSTVTGSGYDSPWDHNNGV
ncbi:hypothetical protein PspLS_12154 [Pyricularia sp. CBS 133598]|nr:hypothetical protein PspLS_12154 [Pyricularia sp. CBS 133598]